MFEVDRDIQKIARDLSCCSEVNKLVLYQSSQGYTSKYEGKIPGPRPPALNDSPEKPHILLTDPLLLIRGSCVCFNACARLQAVSLLL